MPESVNRYRELFDDFIISTTPAENGDMLCYCPIHENPATSKKPSGVINFTPKNRTRFPFGMLHCFKCDLVGDKAGLEYVAEQYKKRLNAGEKFGKAERSERSHTFKGRQKPQPLPSTDTLSEYQAALFEDREAFNALRVVRGLTRATMEKFGVGWMASKGAYCYPVYKDGELYAIRMYRLSHTVLVRHFWYNSETEHIPQLFGTEGLESEPVVILLEGEFDTMLAQQDGFKAVSHNAGAGKFRDEWATWFQGKIVYVAYDNDESGRKGREKVKRILAKTAEAIYFVDIPGPDKVDYTDFRKGIEEDNYPSHSAAEFQQLLDDTRQFGPVFRREQIGLPTNGKRVSITSSKRGDLARIPLELQVQATGNLANYTIPAKVLATCSLDKGQKVCATCPLGLANGSLEKSIEKNDEIIAKAIGTPSSSFDKLILKEVIEAHCTDRSKIEVIDSYAVECVAVSESVESRGTNDDDIYQTNDQILVYNVGHNDSSDNEIFRLVGHSIPNPKNHETIFVSWVREATRTNIDQFKMEPSIHDDLKVFQPASNQTPYQKMQHIAHDLSENVIGLEGRDDVAIACDIVWHSVLGFTIWGQEDKRGWVEAIIVGDTRTGKTKTGAGLAKYYKQGRVFSTETSSYAGLVGGLMQPDAKRWQTSWGVIPQNDRRLLMLDECQNIKQEVKRMGSIRSEGRAEMTKIGNNKSTSARTRLIWVLNPEKGLLRDLKDTGVTAIRQFMPDAEDRSRFDFGIAVARGDVDASVINQSASKKRALPTYSSQACEWLVLWAWSRKSEQIKFASGTEDYIIDVTEQISEKYGQYNDFEFVQPETMRVKLARISVAIATRLFSTDDSGENVIVRNGHVDAAREFLYSSYDNPSFGLGRASDRSKRRAKEAGENLPVARKWFQDGHVQGIDSRYGKDLFYGLKRVTTGNRFSIHNAWAMLGIDRDTANSAINMLLDMSLAHVEDGEVVMSAELMELIRELDEE